MTIRIHWFRAICDLARLIGGLILATHGHPILGVVLAWIYLVKTGR